MNEFGQQNPTLFVIALVGMIAGMWLVTGWLISFLSGWAALAEQYRTDRSFPEHKRWMQGAMMRWGCHYNGILTLASDDDGLYTSELAGRGLHPLGRHCLATAHIQL